MAKKIMIQGTMSNAGKSMLVAGLCRIFAEDGYRVAPFKSQNMALNSYITKEGLEMGRAQVMQAEAAGIEPVVAMNPILLKPTNDVGSQVIVNGEVLGTMSAYYRIIMGGMIFNCISMVVNSSQRGAGNTKITMRTNLTANVLNIIFNYLLIGGHFGFPALGVSGAALATVLGTVVGCIMSILSITKPDGYISIPYMLAEKIRPTCAALKSLVHVGYSIFFEQVLMRIGFMATAIMAAAQGTEAMAAHQVGMNIMSLSFSFGDGLQSAAVALIGYSLGAKDPDMAKAYGKTCRIIGGCFSVCLALVYFFGARALYTAFFPGENAVIQYGIHIMYIIIITVLFQIAQVIYMGCLRGAGDTLYTAIASTISVTLVRTIASYFFGYTLGLGIEGIWLGVLADQLSRFTFASIRFRQGKWVHITI